jgi:hypothetical protein
MSHDQEANPKQPEARRTPQAFRRPSADQVKARRAQLINAGLQVGKEGRAWCEAKKNELEKLRREQKKQSESKKGNLAEPAPAPAPEPKS